MAKITEAGISGKLGDVVYCTRKNGTTYVRKHWKIGAERFATDPKFASAKKNATEFGRASTITKTIRAAFREVVPYIGQLTLPNELQKKVLKVIQSDRYNEYGMRSFLDGDVSLLTDVYLMRERMLPDFTAELQSPAGKQSSLTLLITPGRLMKISLKMLRPFRMYVLVKAIDFYSSTATYEYSKILPWDFGGKSYEANLDVNMPTDRSDTWFIAVGIEEEDKDIPAGHGEFGALKLISVVR
jgi:hypothetical protein